MYIIIRPMALSHVASRKAFVVFCCLSSEFVKLQVLSLMSIHWPCSVTAVLATQTFIALTQTITDPGLVFQEDSF